MRPQGMSSPSTCLGSRPSSITWSSLTSAFSLVGSLIQARRRIRVPVGIEDIVDQLLVAGFGGGRAILPDPDLPHQLADRVLFVVEHPLPARALLLGPRHQGAVEGEVLLVEVATQVVGEGVDEVPAQVILPGVERKGGQGGVGVGEELGLADHDRVDGGNSQPREAAPAQSMDGVSMRS